MRIVVSGVTREFTDAVNVAALVRQIADDARGIAVAVNDEVVRRSVWDERPLQDGDRVEIVRAVQGG